MRLRSLTAVFAAAACAVVGVVAPAEAETVDVSPPGANNWSCRTSQAHPYPVVLVHGTFENMVKNWAVLSPKIADAGYCVFAFNYGNDATGPIADSAKELAAFVEKVRDATGVRKVDLVGHSQGGMMPRYYLKNLGGAAKVDKLIGIVPSNHGTSNPLTIPTGYLGCQACTEQRAGSDFLTELNQGGDTVQGPDYTVVTTTYDEVVTPYTSAFLDGRKEDVTNITVQDSCSADVIEHDQSPNDPVVGQWVLHALGQKDAPADPAFKPDCLG